MKDRLLLDRAIGARTKAAIAGVIACESENFGELVQSSQLDPRRHLRHSNLRDVDFSDTNLDGYDFTGCDLRGAHGIRVQWSPDRTVLKDAQLDGSLFAHQMKLRSAMADAETKALDMKLRSLTWANQIIWAMENLSPANANLDRNRLLASSIFAKATDSFLRGEILKYLEKSALAGDGLYDMMLDIINGNADDVHLITKTITILANSRMHGHPGLQKAIEALVNSNDERIVARAIEFLTSAASSIGELKAISKLALAHRAPIVRFAFIRLLTKRLGPKYDFVARSQTTHDYRDVHQPVRIGELLVLIRNIQREVKSEQESIRKGAKGNPNSLLKEFEGVLQDERLLTKLRGLFATLAEFGMPPLKVPAVENWTPIIKTIYVDPESINRIFRRLGMANDIKTRPRPSNTLQI